jgi:hypothetical protein
MKNEPGLEVIYGFDRGIDRNLASLTHSLVVTMEPSTKARDSSSRSIALAHSTGAVHSESSGSGVTGQYLDAPSKVTRRMQSMCGLIELI